MVVLPVIVLVVFSLLYFYDKARGGYHKVALVQHQETPQERVQEAPTVSQA